MKLTRKARAAIINQFLQLSKRAKEDLIEMIRPHYIPNYKSLVEQDLNRLANAIAARIKDETGARKVFAVGDNGKRVLINVDTNNDLKDIEKVYDSLMKARDCRNRSIEKVFRRKAEVAGQTALEFDSEGTNQWR